MTNGGSPVPIGPAEKEYDEEDDGEDGGYEMIDCPEDAENIDPENPLGFKDPKEEEEHVDGLFDLFAGLGD